MKIPVLTYHSAFVGSDYETNNLIALSADLQLVDSLGFRIVPLVEAVATFISRSRCDEKVVAISLDDGTDFDYRDLDHPVFGNQRSAYNVLREFVARFGVHRQPTLHATSFVIVSPVARREIDERCLIGAQWYSDAWWPDAAASKLMGIASHSWDHNHPETSSEQKGIPRGTFRTINNITLADYQIRQAQEYLVAKAPNPATCMFAYPYGESNEYLTREYFPRFGPELGIRAAFGTESAPITEGSNLWDLPRFVFGANWKTQQELAQLLCSST